MGRECRNENGGLQTEEAYAHLGLCAKWIFMEATYASAVCNLVSRAHVALRDTKKKDTDG